MVVGEEEEEEDKFFFFLVKSDELDVKNERRVGWN